MTTDTITEPETVDVSKFLEFLPRKLMIRYFLSYDSYGFSSFSAWILSAPGLPQRQLEYCLVSEFSSNRNEFSSSSLGAMHHPGETASDVLAERLTLWKGRIAGYPWWKPFLEPVPFVGVMTTQERVTSQERVVRTLPAESPHFALHNGLIAAKLGARLEHLKSLADLSPGIRAEFEATQRLIRQFDAFLAQSQEIFIAQILGMTPK